MILNKGQATALLREHVTDTYQRLHAQMVATAMEGYAGIYNEDKDLWYVTGLLHDIDFQEYPDQHPGPSLGWFADWGYSDDLIHAVEAHAYGYNGFDTLPETKLASALMAIDELCGIFYAYQKLNPIPYGEMKAKSIKKRLNESKFAPKIERESIYRGVEHLGVTLDEHIDNMITFLARLDQIMEKKWQLPPIEKAYEAMTAVVSDRVELVSPTEAKVWSSTRSKYYEVSYDTENHLIMSNDNSAYWKVELGYPAIAYLIAAGHISVETKVMKPIANVPWKKINKQYKNSYTIATAKVLDDLDPAEREFLIEAAEMVTAKVKELDLGLLGKRKFPPKGN